MLAVTGLALRTVGLEPVWGGVTRTRVVKRDASVGVLTRRIERYGRRLPGARLCLPQALAGAVLLRRHGYAAEVVIGVRNGPFAAHAWLVHDGRVVLGEPDRPGHVPIWRGTV